MRPSLSSRTLGALALLVTTAARAQEPANPEGGGAAFLLLPVGARATALGQAAVADGGSSESAFWNPAGLAALPRNEVAVHYSRTFISDNTALTGYFTANRLGVLGASAYLVDYGSQDTGGEPGVPSGRTSPKNIELIASFATTIVGTLDFGVNYKLIQFRQDCTGQCGTFQSVVGTTHGVDVGIRYAFGRTRSLRLGFVIRHAGFKLQLENEEQADPLPTRVQIGAIYQLPLTELRGSGERFDARIMVDLDDKWGEYNSPDVRVGLDLGLRDVVRLRTGYAFLDSQSRGPSVGVGLRFGRFALDVARVFFVSSNFDEPLHVSLRAFL